MKIAWGHAVARSRHPRRGMTLVELLVVTGLVAVLLGLTVAGARKSSQRPKRVADDLVSMLISAQSRALNVSEGAAVVLSAPIADLVGSGSSASTSAYDAEMLPFIQASGNFSPSVPLGATSGVVSLTPTNGDDVRRAYKILLGGQGSFITYPPTAWFTFVPQSSTSGAVQFRNLQGQTQYNTVWPRVPAGATGFVAALAQCPEKSSALSEFDPAVAVDLRFSGIGDDPTNQFNKSPQGAVAVVFERTGRVAEVLEPVPEPGAAATNVQFSTPFSPIYFLVANRDDIRNGVNTLASADSIWVTLSPNTGRVIQSENVPVSGTDRVALWNARKKARQGLEVGK